MQLMRSHRPCNGEREILIQRIITYDINIMGGTKGQKPTKEGTSISEEKKREKG